MMKSCRYILSLKVFHVSGLIIVYRATMTHPKQWTITELQLKKRINQRLFLDKFINAVTLDKAFIFELAFLMTPSKRFSTFDPQSTLILRNFSHCFFKTH